MEQNLQLIARKTWHIIKIAYFLLRKNISKRKLLLLELKYLATKRPKLAYEFSCSNTPIHHNYFSHTKKTTHKFTNEIEARDFHAVNRVLVLMLNNVGKNPRTVDRDFEGSLFVNSPVLPGFGFGKSPMVRQLRVTDSPYALQNYEEGDICSSYRVDEAADEFIKRFYDQLHQQRVEY